MKLPVLLAAAALALALPNKSPSLSLGLVEWKRPVVPASFASKALDRDDELLKACLGFVEASPFHGPFARVTWLGRTDHGNLLVMTSVEWGFRMPTRQHSHVLLLGNTDQVIGRWEAPSFRSNLDMAGFFIALNTPGSECVFLHARFVQDGSDVE